MSTKTFVIDGSDTKHFALTVNDGILQVGDTPTHAEGIARDLRVIRIHCEVEIEDARDKLPIDQPGVLAGVVLGPDGLHLDHADLLLRDTSETLAFAPSLSPPPPATTADSGSFSLDLDLAGPESTTNAPAQPTATSPAPPAPCRFKVIDGGDQGRSFRLPEVGTVTLGKPGHATIGLNDLYVMRIHCSVEIQPHSILVTHVEGQNGTLIDGQRTAGPTRLRPGGVLRIGNSHLKLETGPFDDEVKGADEWSGEERPRVRQHHGSSSDAPASGKSGVHRVPDSEAEEAQEAEDLDVAQFEDDTLESLKGQVLGHYELGEMLGRGLAGAVYQAVDKKTNQAVALKVFPAGFPSSPAELERVARELKTLQQIHHPNLVTPLGAGKSSHHFWIARDFVPGESAAVRIAAIAEGEKPSWTRTARITIHLARLLDWLHQQGVVHGNITPRNILLREADRATMLADLRLDRALAGSQLLRSVREKKLLADLPYLAPEQAESGAVADNLADLYAVGAVAYAFLTGRPPATGSTLEEIRKELRKRPPRPISIYKKVPPEFDGTVMRLIARSREDRFQTAASLLADLELIARKHELKLERPDHDGQNRQGEKGTTRPS